MSVDQLDALLDLVSSRVGIIRGLHRRAKSDDEPVYPIIYDAALSHYDFRKGESIERGSCGKGWTEDQAMLGAIGESIEHYCASHPSIKSLHRCKASELDGPWVPPPEFTLFSDEQYSRKNFPYWRWGPEDAIEWTQVHELPSLDKVWVPVEFVYLNYRGDQPQDTLCAATSSGLAAGPTLERAIRSAIVELLERDAFILTWLNRLPAPEIDLSQLNGPLAEMLSAFARIGSEVRAFALSTPFNAAATLAIALDRTGQGPAAMIGLGCDQAPIEALRKALFEIGQMHQPLIKRFEEGKADEINSYADVHTLEQHAAYFFKTENLHELDFLLNNGLRTTLAHPRTGDLVQNIRDRGHRIFFRDLTTPDLKDYPISVARALITGIQPIHFGHGVERLGNPRIDMSNLNPCPHPLA